MVKSFTPVQKKYSAPAAISKPATKKDDDDVFSTLLKYEKEVRAEKRDKRQHEKEKDKEKEKKKAKKDKDASKAKSVVASGSGAPQTMLKPSHISAQPTAAVPIKPGTQVTPDEIKLKAKQMVELVRATQIIQTKRLPPTQSTSSTKAASEIRELKNKKPKKMMRVAGGEVWEDKTLMDRDIKEKQVSENIQLKQCKICKKTFKSVYHMKRHAENVHESIRKYACDKCQLVFKRKEHLNDHQTVHASERTFRCELCGYSSSWKCDLVHHMKKFH